MIGDGSSVLKIIDKFMPLILKESGRYKIKSYDYEDLVQHGCLSVIKAAKMFKGEKDTFPGYCVAAIRQNYKALLKGEIKHYREVSGEESLQTEEYAFTIEDEMIAYEKVEILHKAMNCLSEDEKKVISSYYIKESNMDEIAADINKSYNQVRYIKDRAIRKLKNKMKNSNI